MTLWARVNRVYFSFSFHLPPHFMIEILLRSAHPRKRNMYGFAIFSGVLQPAFSNFSTYESIDGSFGSLEKSDGVKG